MRAAGRAKRLRCHLSLQPCGAAAPGRFAGRTIVVTGAGGDLGRAGCRYFAAEGANVVAVDCSAEALANTARLAGSLASGRLHVVTADVTSEEDASRVVTEAIAAFGSIERLWNNAGTMGDVRTVLDYSVSEFRRVLDTNVVGMFIMLKLVAAAMVDEGRGGVICNTASAAGLRGTPAMPAYVTSKSAVLGMTVCAAKDLAKHNIRVNAISPALIGASGMWARQNEEHATSGSPFYATDPSAVAAGKIASVPLRRLGTVDEVVKSVAFLLSDDSSYMTAANLVIDGGMAGGLKA